MSKASILIGSYNYNPSGDVHTLTFTRQDHVSEALELNEDEETSIELPSHAPPPLQEEKKGKKN